MREIPALVSERALILAPHGRDAALAQRILRDARVHAEICKDCVTLVGAIVLGPVWLSLPRRPFADKT